MTESRKIRLAVSGWLYRLAYRIDPGEGPSAPKCIDCGCPLDPDGECYVCAERAERDREFAEVYEAGGRDAWREAEYRFGQP